MSETGFNRMQTLKRRMFAMRNGVVADALRQAGCPRRIIFGLNLPQLTEIASEFGPDAQLALELFRDVNVRESQLLAPMLMPREAVTDEAAAKLAEGVAWAEEADILCNKLLRWLPGAPDLATRLCASENRLKRYTGLRLMAAMTCVNQDERLRKEAVSAALAELRRPEPIAALAAQIIADNDY
ncbi:MAG: DNA alkylation repair protein [Muribaculaceae bacterium]|nr:DNA alkylation repair protein [Muribaculaceae bacterium]